ncbi:MAG: Fic family protein [Desulfobulbaceae bacterium]|nr:Fic family protein [Desulfobulbaceae bacterium]
MNTRQQLLVEIDAAKARLDSLRSEDHPALLHALDIEYTFESNRIEGNTLTLRETGLVIDKGLTVGGKSMREHLEAINHYEAVLLLRELVQAQTPLTESLVKQLHGLILRGIDREKAGRYRGVPVLIAGSRHVPPQPWQVPLLMEECFRFYAEQRELLHPVELAAEMHERIVTIHPFLDGNGRISRLVMNLILLQHGYPIANIPGDIESRLAYYGALESANLDGGKESFILLIGGFVLAAARRLVQLAGGGTE